jgi:hypothetical protein
MCFGNFIFMRCGFAWYQEDGIYPLKCNILTSTDFPVPIEEQDANFEGRAPEPIM